MNMFNLMITIENDLKVNEKFDTFDSLKQYLMDHKADLLSNESDRELPSFDKVENLEDIRHIFSDYNTEKWSADISLDV